MMTGAGLDGQLGLPFGELRASAREDTALRTGISVVPAARMWTPLGLAT